VDVAAESEAEASAALSRTRRRAWDLESGVGVVRVRATCSEGRCVVMWMHHIMATSGRWTCCGKTSTRRAGERLVAIFAANVGVCRMGVGAAAARGRSDECVVAQHLKGCKALKLEGMD
jgi:hypothetical protein